MKIKKKLKIALKFKIGQAVPELSIKHCFARFDHKLKSIVAYTETLKPFLRQFASRYSFTNNMILSAWDFDAEHREHA